MRTLAGVLLWSSLVLFSGKGIASSRVDEGVFVVDPNRVFLEAILADGRFTFDHPKREGYEIYGPSGLYEWLEVRNIPHRELAVEGFLEGRWGYDYPSFVEIEGMLKALHEKFPRITQLISIGKSVEGRDLWMMKVSDNPSLDELEPEFKYIANMHGDEIAGRELMVRLLRDLLESYELGHDSQIVKLIEETEIYIMPSMNPDGAEERMRGNAHFVDLNRDFPDFSVAEDNQNTLEGRAVETKAVMNFQAGRNFALSANFHGGAEVVNYPWDTIADRHPFFDLVYEMSREYAGEVSYMKNSSEFPDGVTDGFAWYEVNGGMQDWSYFWYGDLQVTVELSNKKWPDYSSIEPYYDQNRSSLLKYISRIHQGAGFRLSKPNRQGEVRIYRVLSNGTLQIVDSFPFRNSEFYKVLQPGRYWMMIEANGEPVKVMETVVSKDRIHSNYQYF